MKLIADLHIHSRFSRACSKQITIPNLEKYAKIKGVDILGTGDFTHPFWIKELKKDLIEDGSGILKTGTGFPFVLQTEISLMYSQQNSGRKIHVVVLAPDFEIVDQITEYLKTKGRVDYDGRPIFGISAIEFTEALKKISKDIELIPAHVWTPWFGLFGSKSGFDSVKEAFADQEKNIYALETGLSSDPSMNWRLSFLDKYQLVSFSDSHSFWPWRMAREATVFDIKLDYKNLINAIRSRRGLVETIEVNPSYGKYHFDGHRVCKVCLNPGESIKKNNICSKCGRKLTIGVLHRVEELADREEGYKLKGAVGFKTLIPLSELISAVLGIQQLYSKGVWQIHTKLIKEFKNEFNVLLDVSLEDLKKVVDEKLAKVIIKNRNGEIKVEPGYDGVYGDLVLEKSEVVRERKVKEEKIEKFKPEQKTLGEF